MAASLSAGAILAGLCGCGAGVTSPASGVASAPGTLHISGKANGGQQPIYNATVQLWAAGTTTGYGQGATSLIASSVKTGTTGVFDITGTYTCPTPDPQVYLTATGGNPSGDGTTTTNNSNIQLVAALGSCSTLLANASTTFIQLNEVTTAAAAFALGQFYGGFGTTSDQIGAPSTNVAGLVNAFATAHNLSNVATGTPAPTTAASGTNYFMSQNDNQKLNTIANILAYCVNQTTSNSTGCANQFAYVTPKYAPMSTSTAATAPVNTFQAAVYMSLNPTSVDTNGTSNMSNLYNEQSAFAPFATALSAAPTDWTLALNYTGTGINYNSGVAIDSNGDVWLSNANTTGGMVMLNGGTGTAPGSTAGVAGGVVGFFTSPAAYPAVNGNGARSITVDLNDKAWIGNFAQSATTPNTNGYYFLRATSSGVDAYFNIPTGTTQPYAIAADPTGKIFTTTTSTSATYVSATGTSGGNTTVKTAVEGSSGNTNIAMTTGNIAYVSASNGSLYPLNTSTLVAGTAITNATTGFSTPYGSATDGSSRLWVTNDPASSFFLTLYDPTGNSGAGTFTQFVNTCLQKPGFIAIDGNNNVWVTNQNVASGTDYGVCEFNTAGTLISNSIGFHLHGLQSSRGIAVDRSGNVWVSNYTMAASDSVTQIVGAAVPAVTPLSLAIKNGKVGTRP